MRGKSAAVLILACLALGTAVTARAATIRVQLGGPPSVEAGWPPLEISGDVRPRDLPRKGTHPIRLTLDGDLRLDDDSLGIREAQFSFDNAFSFSPAVFDQCALAAAVAAQDRCKGAVVGTGSVEVATSQGDSAERRPLSIINSSSRASAMKLLLISHAALPSLVGVAVVQRQTYGEHLTLSFRRPLGGEVKVKGFSVTLRPQSRGGKIASAAFARCPRRGFLRSNLLSFELTNGSSLRGERSLTWICTPSTRHKALAAREVL